MLRRVHANSANLFHGRSPLSEICNDLILAQSMPSGAVHTIIAGHHVDRRFRALLLMGAVRCLAIDGDDLGRHLGQRRDPGDEAALEGLRVERGENITQMIMCGRAVRYGEPIPPPRAEPAQEVELLFAKAGDVGKRLSPRQTASRQSSRISSSG